jgi:hypothetical protein
MTKIKRIIASVLLAVFVLLANSGVALANVKITPIPSEIQLEPGAGFGGVTGFNIAQLIQTAIKFVLIAAAIFFFFALIIGGIRWILAGGDKAGTEAARKIITNALIGLAIVLSAWAITALIGQIFGVDILNPQIPTLSTTGPNS